MSQPSRDPGGRAGAGRLWRVRRVPVPPQFAGRGEDAFLQVVELLAAFFRGRGTGLASAGLGGGPGRGLPDEGVPWRGGPWRGACLQFPEMAGLGHPQAGVLRAQAQRGPGSFRPLRWSQGLGTEARQDRFDDGGVIEQNV